MGADAAGLGRAGGMTAGWSEMEAAGWLTSGTVGGGEVGESLLDCEEIKS